MVRPVRGRRPALAILAVLAMLAGTTAAGSILAGTAAAASAPIAIPGAPNELTQATPFALTVLTRPRSSTTTAPPPRAARGTIVGPEDRRAAMAPRAPQG